MFLILPLGLLWVMAISLKSGNLFGAITPLVLIVVTIGAFLYLRRRYFVKVVLTDAGIILNGLLRLVTVPWDHVQAIRISEESFHDTIEVHTTVGRFLLPAMMIRRAQPFPKLAKSPEGVSWLLADGTRLPVNTRNSPLYNELQRRIAPNI